jgi:hypothetical protein
MRCLISRYVHLTQRETYGCKADFKTNSSLYLVKYSAKRKTPEIQIAQCTDFYTSILYHADIII